jgi:putative ABC transport system permease protein
MFRNYLTIALRNLVRHKAYSIINVGGLAIGIVCCLLILLFVRDELSYDRFHEKAERIFRLVDSFDVEGSLSRHFALSSAPFAPALKQKFPQVEDAVRLFPGRRRLVSYGERKYYEDGLIFADASLFDIFTFPLVKGDPVAALKAPNRIVVSEAMALKYFGPDDPLNQTLKINDQEFLISGVMREVPDNSHFHADMFASLKTLEQDPAIQKRYFQNWVRHEFYTYLLLQEGAQVEELEARLPRFIQTHAAQQIRNVLGGTLSSQLQPLTKIHLHSHLQFEIGRNGDIKYVAVFSVIALFILLIAGVNYVNLATARSVGRSREIGLRKVVGANRLQLIRQFLGESSWFTLLGMGLALILLSIILPAFNALTGKALAVHDLASPFLLVSLIAILLIVGPAAGCYPAFFMARFKPVEALKRGPDAGSQRSRLRRILVVLQFGISIALIISTAVVLAQLDFLRNRKLGFDKEHVVVIPVRAASIRNDAEAIKADLMQNPAITAATIAIGVPGGVVAGDAIQLLTPEGKKTLTVRMIYTDHDYIRTMGLEIAQGRDFSKAMLTDTDQAFIINEAAVRTLELTDPLSTRFEWGEKRGQVVGVVKDYQFQSLKQEINPLVIHIWPASTRVFAMRIRPENIPETLKYIEGKWRKLDPEHPFEFSFLDQTFDALYNSEETLGRVFSIFSFLAVFIASLGLFGLAMFVVHQRTKEIGIRKVLGASVGKILVLLCREFAWLVLIANLLAWPAAYFFMHRWLENFAYRMDMQPRIFILSAGVALVLALFTISFLSIKAALADPVQALRHE